jgi:hypothetical protein
MTEFKIIEYKQNKQRDKIIGIKRFTTGEANKAVTLKGMESRVVDLEHLLNTVGHFINSNNCELNKGITKETFSRLIDECEKHNILKQTKTIISSNNDSTANRSNNSDSSDSNNIISTASSNSKTSQNPLYSTQVISTKNTLVKALNFWYQNTNVSSLIEGPTSSNKLMETVYFSYFKEFDPYQMYFSPDFFFKKIINNKEEGNLLGPVTTVLSLRVAKLHKNAGEIRFDYLHEQCLQLIQYNLHLAYSNPSVDNVMALMFLSLYKMSNSDIPGFLNSFAMACKMALLLELNKARDLYRIHPRGTPKWFELNKMDILWQVLCSTDSFLSIIYGLPSQFPKTTKWLKSGQMEETMKFINKTPFYSIPTNPPKFISNLDFNTPAIAEVNLISLQIINHVKCIKEKYHHIENPKDIPIQEIFMPSKKFSECLKLYKVIQSGLIDQYTKDTMRNYIKYNEEHKGFLRLIDNIVQSLVLAMKFHYPHLLIYPQPVIMPSSYTPRLAKITEQVITIFLDFVKFKPKDKEIRCPIQVDHLWSCLFSCLNLSLISPSNRINHLIERCLYLLTEGLDAKFSLYKLSDLPKYLTRYGHSIDQYECSFNTSSDLSSLSSASPSSSSSV